MECVSTFWPYEVRYFSLPISFTSSGWMPWIPEVEDAPAPPPRGSSPPSPSPTFSTTSSIRAGWMRPSVMSAQGDPGDLAADRVEAGQDDRLGGVVDDDVDAGGGFEGADVPPLAADDPPLHLLGRQRHRAHDVLGDVVRRVPLDGQGDHLPGLLRRLLLELLVHDPDPLAGFHLGLFGDQLHDLRLGLLGRKARHLLELWPGSPPAGCRDPPGRLELPGLIRVLPLLLRVLGGTRLGLLRLAVEVVLFLEEALLELASSLFRSRVSFSKSILTCSKWSLAWRAASFRMFAASFLELWRISAAFSASARASASSLVQRALFPGKQERHVHAEPHGQRRRGPR